MRRLEFLLQGGKEGRLFERSEFASPPSLRQKFKGKSPHRARLSLLTFFGKTKKVSQPRQGMKQGMHHQQKNHPLNKQKPQNPTGEGVLPTFP
jgi:hypothetical protein